MTKEDDVNSVAEAMRVPIRFEPMMPLPKDTSLADFHEWNVAFAITKFEAKRSNDENVSYFNMKRGEIIHVMKTMWQNEDEKIVTFDFVRMLCSIREAGIDMISMVQEVWVAAVKAEDADKYGSVRETPGREDALLVSTFTRDGGSKMTKWVVKLHRTNPDKNIMLARDDTDSAPDKGRASNFFEPEKPIIKGEPR